VTSLDILGMYRLIWETASSIELKTDQDSCSRNSGLYCSYHTFPGFSSFLFSLFFFYFYSCRPAGDEELAGRVSIAEMMELTLNRKLSIASDVQSKSQEWGFWMQSACELLLTVTLSNIPPTVPFQIRNCS